ncbi:MAG: hypothetical protein ACE5JP_06290 [Candidatus Bipolaricaulia bacterium]
MPDTNDRHTEWFVPSIGPIKFRIFVGLLFLPYTGMVLAYTVIGATLAGSVDMKRVGALAVVYFLALGIAAHALDALGSRGVKPWATHFSPAQLWSLMILTSLPAAVIGGYYALYHAPLLWPIGLLEFFFLFAYNLEWFNGRFHTDGWFFFSWGVLPVLAGYVMQTNRLSLAALLVALAAGLFSLVEITASRPYKVLKRAPGQDAAGPRSAAIYERILKSISLGVILLGLGMLLWRLRFPFSP